jgi:trigger factor
VQSGEGLERRMTVGLAQEAIDSEVEKRLRDFARSARLPGFRPGKVPVKVLRQRYGQRLRQEVVGEMVQSSFSQAVAQENLRPAGAPHIEPEIDETGGRYGYTATFEVLPSFELGSLEGKVIKQPVAEVTDADLDALIGRLREQRKTWSPVERAAQSGDKVTISYEGSVDGESFPGGSGKDVEIELGTGRMIPGFESGLVGAAAGEERTLELMFPGDYRAEQLAGKAATFAVTVHEVAEPVLPELDAEFAKSFGVEDGDLERFRNDVRTNMERELKQRIEGRMKQQTMDLLLQANPIELPQVLVTQEIGALREQTSQGIKGSSSFQLPDSLFEEQARRRVALGLIIAEVVKANGIQVDPKRVREAVEDMASTYEDPQEVIDFYYKNKQHLASFESLALEGQVVDWVRERVTVEDEPTSFHAVTEGDGA